MGDTGPHNGDEHVARIVIGRRMCETRGLTAPMST
jgi:hypothetical protein